MKLWSDNGWYVESYFFISTIHKYGENEEIKSKFWKFKKIKLENLGSTNH
jgi:hypothetical protein